MRCSGAGNQDSFNTVLNVGTVSAPAMGRVRKCKETKDGLTRFPWGSKHDSSRALRSDFHLVMVFIYGKQEQNRFFWFCISDP